MRSSVFFKTHWDGDDVIRLYTGWSNYSLLKEQNRWVYSLGYLLFQLDLEAWRGKCTLAMDLQLIGMKSSGPISALIDIWHVRLL